MLALPGSKADQWGYFTLPHTGITDHAPLHPAFGAGDANSGPHAYTASVLPTQAKFAAQPIMV